jgi:hypothetical protein
MATISEFLSTSCTEVSYMVKSNSSPTLVSRDPPNSSFHETHQTLLKCDRCEPLHQHHPPSLHLVHDLDRGLMLVQGDVVGERLNVDDEGETAWDGRKLGCKCKINRTFQHGSYLLYHRELQYVSLCLT